MWTQRNDKILEEGGAITSSYNWLICSKSWEKVHILPFSTAFSWRHFPAFSVGMSLSRREQFKSFNQGFRSQGTREKETTKERPPQAALALPEGHLSGSKLCRTTSQEAKKKSASKLKMQARLLQTEFGVQDPQGWTALVNTPDFQVKSLKCRPVAEINKHLPRGLKFSLTLCSSLTSWRRCAPARTESKCWPKENLVFLGECWFTTSGDPWTKYKIGPLTQRTRRDQKKRKGISDV